MNLTQKASNAAFELKQDGTSAKITGYASTFGNMDNVGDIVLKGAFGANIREWKKKDKLPPLLYQHDMRAPIGKLDAMKEDDKGLYIEATILKGVQKGNEAIALVEAGVLDSMSIGYVVKDFDYDFKKSIRNLKALNLHEVSIVTFPANEQAEISGIKGVPKTIREFEEFLRDVGFSREQAKGIASQGFKGIESERDVGIEATLKNIEKFTTNLRS